MAVSLRDRRPPPKADTIETRARYAWHDIEGDWRAASPRPAGSRRQSYATASDRNFERVERFFYIGAAALVVVEEVGSSPRPALSISLFAGLMKGKKMERLVRDAAALGVESVTPFISSRTIPKDIGDMKLERMKKIAVEESGLSGRNRPLQVRPPVAFADAVRSGADLSLFVWEEETTDIREVIRSRRTTPATVGLFTGPEGGFSAGEAKTAADAGLVSVGLGRRIIRAETAPLVAAAIVQYEWGDL
jgi:16S rRNA (uracil1498-N3)-methyltransferase